MMLFNTREETLEAIGNLGKTRCSYTHGPTIEDWLKTKCDCKYGYEGPVHGGEKNCCPELRSVYQILSEMTDEDWLHFLTKAGGVISFFNQDEFGETDD